MYYRRRIVSSARDLVTVGLILLDASGCLGRIFIKSLGDAAEPALVADRNRRRWAGPYVSASFILLPDPTGKRGPPRQAGTGRH